MAEIVAAKLIEKFQYALNNKWGYIWGTAGEIWTQAKQNSLVKSFESKYGTNWKSNATAKKADKYYGAVYGSKWIGHMVADCSGLFSWAFKQLGGYMYHGSNTMYSKYCTSKGKLTKKGRTDGQTLKPGTAVFTGNDSNHGHVGLYIGNDIVIEASGSNAGVITTKISDGKWTYWGELKGVNYDASSSSSDKKEENKVPENDISTKSAVVTGTRLALREAPSTSAKVLTRVNTGERVQILDDTEWVKVKYQGKTGYMMAKYLKF